MPATATCWPRSGRYRGHGQGFNIADISKSILVPSQIGGQLHLEFFPTGGVEHLEPNLDPSAPLQKVDPLASLKVRQALSLVVVRSAALEKGLGIPAADIKPLVAYSPEAPGRFDGLAVPGVWDPIKRRFVTTPQPADAAKLLDQAGYRLQNGIRYDPGCTTDTANCEMAIQILVPKGMPIAWSKFRMRFSTHGRTPA